eukprot:CAMPEP_0206628138 /NCGR_PEP_ID=MMETSP0325_2-20121206/66355_1 /ASSEMBLY_ACC=CAM_ASM_000347 /TAXON_ID=2866 /ORGANISM="Crypthecodinium cohnii, Strain Seligo" /LENGTH=77 /DNA_ID=CAMNT_0054152861 /DNA_START=188 /DNA_END=422 /DNA_ORIENTATION=-
MTLSLMPRLSAEAPRAIDGGTRMAKAQRAGLLLLLCLSQVDRGLKILAQGAPWPVVDRNAASVAAAPPRLSATLGVQ